MKVLKNILIVLLVVVLVGGVIALVMNFDGILSKFEKPNNTTEEQESFAVVIDNAVITDDKGGYLIAKDNPLLFDIQGLGDTGLKYRVIKNEDAEFTFIVDGKTHSFLNTEQFPIELGVKNNQYFLGIDKNLKEILAENYNGEHVVIKDFDNSKDMFTLILSNGVDELKIGFSIYVEVSIALSETHIVF